MINKEKINLIISYIKKSNKKQSQKRPSSVLSPVEKEHQNEKANMENNETDQQIQDLNIGNLKKSSRSSD